jgi:oxalate decarboxylase/phosphoglucose isomerase-like protein (cupin superfamily)
MSRKKTTPGEKHDHSIAAELSRRGLFGAGGSVLAGAIAAGLVGAGAPAAAVGGGATRTQAAPPKKPTVFDLDRMAIDPESGPGGTVQMARQAQFAFMNGATVARVTMKPSSSRAPHWHLNSWEVQFCVSGSCTLSSVDAQGVLHEDILKAGFVGFAPQGWLHSLRTVGAVPCVLYLCWGDPALQTQELAEAMGRLPASTVAGALGISLAQLNALTKTRRLVTTNAANS